MVTQAFLYNSIFFTYALILTNFYKRAERLGGLVSAAVCGGQLPRPACCWATSSIASAGG